MGSSRLGVADSNRRSFAVPIACLLIALALLSSGALLEWAFFPAGTIVGTARREVVLDSFRILILAAGVYLLLRKPRITVVELLATVVVSLIFGLAGAMLLQVAYVPPPVVSGWKSFVAATEQNQLGFRGRQFDYKPNDYVILLLGDSQVEATALAFDAMPERLLERYLGSANIKVFSVGAGGYGQDQQLLALQEYFATYRANLVVLWQTPGNDVWNNVFRTHMGNRNTKPTFWIDESGDLCGPTESLLQPLANSRVVVASLWQLAFGLPWQDKRWERELPTPYVPLDQYTGTVRTEWQERWDTNLGRMRDENLDTEKSHMAVLLTPRSKRMQYGLDLTRALMQRIRELASAKGAGLIILQVDDHTITPEKDGVYVLNGKYYRVSNRQYLSNWDYVNTGFDVEVIPVTAKDWRVGPEDGHLNTQATDQVMSDLAERLRPKIRETNASKGVTGSGVH